MGFVVVLGLWTLAVAACGQDDPEPGAGESQSDSAQGDADGGDGEPSGDGSADDQDSGDDEDSGDDDQGDDGQDDDDSDPSGDEDPDDSADGNDDDGTDEVDDSADADSDEVSESGNEDSSSSGETGNDSIEPKTLVDRLDYDRFKDNIATLAGFGSHYWEHEGNAEALNWLEDELASYGYEVERHLYNMQGRDMENVYATKVGSTRPSEMYIVSAHMDSINLGQGGDSFAPGANDDASGSSLVLEAARVFAGEDVETEVSIRFILWNNEETGLNGSTAYARNRAILQGKEDPAGSGLYPEPTWLGVIQHDKILFDHGLPPGPTQSEVADIDIEYQRRSDRADASKMLAERLFAGNETYAHRYPAEVGDNMNYTDSKPFQDLCPSVSVRENQRVAEIGNGSDPHWHEPTDVMETYSEADFALGFDTVRTTVGTMAELAGLVNR